MPLNYFAYIRVSTPKQGEKGVSLQEQRDAISRYAERQQLFISQWFEERVTAAKRGRLVFAQMLKLLRARKAQGVIIHKIDRSARNLRDWADLGELIDSGVEIHFANESLDLNTRGGRLSADIQAVVAADYIRNLREETRKGFYGRLKQGLYPLPAPAGYKNTGKGRAKEVDSIRAPLVKLAFELYATGDYNLNSLGDELFRRGLRGRTGKRMSRAHLSTILNNPFYIGLIRVRTTKETFAGIHPPLVSKTVYDRVQRILQGKTNKKSRQHQFVFRRMFVCSTCRWALSGERQKGHVYYRCHSQTCPKTCFREEVIEDAVLHSLKLLNLAPTEHEYAKQQIEKYKRDWKRHQLAFKQSLQLKLDHNKELMNRLTDAFLERLIDKEAFDQRKTGLLMDQKSLEEQVARCSEDESDIAAHLENIFELASEAYSRYKTAMPDEKRWLLETLTSNRAVTGKKLVFALALPFREIANRAENANGGPYRATLRTVDQLLQKLIAYCKENPAPVFAAKPEDEFRIAA